MLDLPSLKRETRYGIPSADQILFNRHYVIGYSYYFRQAKWAIEIVDPDKEDIDMVARADNFRADFRVPQAFRADKQDYRSSGYDRGHLVASANQRDQAIQNSETFLLSNMCPQVGQFNRGIWRQLENRVRELDGHADVLETYVISGPVFDFTRPVETIGARDNNQVTLPVPHAFFKSILTEHDSGELKFWSFVIPNEKVDHPLEHFTTTTTQIEQFAGLQLWDRLVGAEIERKKQQQTRLW